MENRHGILNSGFAHNDALHSFQDNPKGFGEAVLSGLDQAFFANQQVSVPFDNYCNYIHVEPSRHADHHALFVFMGNCLNVVGEYEKDWKSLCARNPTYAKDILKRAKELLKNAEKTLKAVPKT